MIENERTVDPPQRAGEHIIIKRPVIRTDEAIDDICQ
jgi:hypothetical protein